MQAERVNVPPQLRMKVLVRDGHRCIYCGATKDDTEIQVDHVIPVCRGGTNDIGNLVAACRDCNIGKGGKLLLDILDSDVGVYVNKPAVDEFGAVPAKALRDEFAESPLDAWIPKFAERWTHVMVAPPPVTLHTRCNGTPTIEFAASLACHGRENSDIGSCVRVLVLPWRSIGGFSRDEEAKITAAVISGYEMPTIVLMGTPSLFFGVVITGRHKGTPRGRIVDHFLEPLGEWSNDSWYPDETLAVQDLREPFRRTPEVMHVIDYDEESDSITGVYASFDGMGVWNGL